MQKNYKYKAFISYSHQDEKFGKWLHKALEKYKIPKELRKDYLDLPEKLYPIFRDREELPTSSDLSKNITEALEDSKYLIVICSVNSAQSFWVNQEIIDFKSMHGEDRILAIILDGEPHAKTSDKFDDSLECFPEALKFKVVDGALSDERTEPIAGDVREGKDGREFGKLKLVAGLLGVGFEELYRREEKRQKQRRVFLVGALGGVSALAGVSIWKWIEADEKSIALEKQKIILQEEVIKVKHNVGVALLEKAKLALKNKDNARAILFAYYALDKLSSIYDNGNTIVKAKSIILSHDYERIAYQFEHQSGMCDGEGGVDIVIFSEDKKRILLNSVCLGKLEIYDLYNAKLRKEISHYHDYVKSITFSPDDKYILVGGSLEDGKVIDNSINVLNLEGKLIHKMKGHNSYICNIFYSKDKKRIISVTIDGIVKIWSSNNFKCIKTLDLKIKSEFNKYNVEYIKDKNIILIYFESNQKIKAWSLENGKFLKKVNKNIINRFNKKRNEEKYYLNKFTSISVSDDRYDTRVKVWNKTHSKQVVRIEKENVDRIIYNSNERLMSSVSIPLRDYGKEDFYKIKILDIKSNKIIKKWYKNNEKFIDMKFLPDKIIVISKITNRTLNIWDITNNKLIRNMEIRGRLIDFSINGKIIIWKTENAINIYNLKNDKLLNTIDIKSKGYVIGAYSVNRNTFMLSTGYVIELWDLHNGNLLKEINLFPQYTSSIVYSPMGDTFVLGSYMGGTFQIWNSKEMKPITKELRVSYLDNNSLTEDNVKIVYLANGKRIVTSRDRTIQLWNVNDGKLLATLNDNTVYADSLNCLNNGKIAIGFSRYKDGDEDDTEGEEYFSVKTWDVTKFDKIESKKYIYKQINLLEQQLQEKLEGITLVQTKIPYTKPKWSKQHPFYWLDKAENGDSEAMYQLGLIYDRNNENDKALEWYKKSSTKGHDGAKERVEFLEGWMRNNLKSI